MKITESYCVGCPPELGCLGKACPYAEVIDYECDACGAPAYYRIDGEDFCEDCAEELLESYYKDLAMWERAEILGLKLEKIWG